MSQEPAESLPITLSVDDVERLVRKIEGLESVLREVVVHLGSPYEPINYISTGRMLSTLSEEDIRDWLREKIQE
jgi:hypothetical protein